MFIPRSTGAMTAYVNVFRDLTTSLDSCFKVEHKLQYSVTKRVIHV